MKQRVGSSALSDHRQQTPSIDAGAHSDERRPPKNVPGEAVADSISELANALLVEIESNATREGRIVAIEQTLRSLLSAGSRDTGQRAAVNQSRVRQIPGWDDCSRWYRATTAPSKNSKSKRSEKSCDVKKNEPALSSYEVLLRHRLCSSVFQKLVGHPTPPTLRYFRQLAIMGAMAHIACQWGCFSEAKLILEQLSPCLWSLRNRAICTEQQDDHFLGVESILALLSPVAIDRGYPLLATAMTRRLCANLGALCRAAARIEGLPGCDPLFDGPADAVESVAGVPRTAAEWIVKTMLRSGDLSST